MKLVARVFLLSLLTIFPVLAGEWRVVAPVPAMLPSASAVVINDHVYVLSGTVGQGLRQFFEVYDPRDDGWRPLTPLPANIDRFGVGTLNGRIIVTGGRERQTGEAVSDAWLYVHESALWVEVTPLPEAVFGHSVVEFGGALYLIGGEGKNNFWRLDRQLQQWTALPSLPVTTYGAMATSDSNYIYLVNGATAWRWAPEAGWKQLPDLPEAVANAGVAVLSDGLHVVGGYRDATKSASAKHYVFQSGKWKTLPNLPQARHLMGTAVYEDRLYVIGGASAGGFFSFFTGSDNLYVFQN